MKKQILLQVLAISSFFISCSDKELDIASMLPTTFKKANLFTSDNKGLDWQMSENELVLAPGTLSFDDDTSVFCDRTADMPKLYFENGKPKALIIATLPKGEDDSFVTIIPFKKN